MRPRATKALPGLRQVGGGRSNHTLHGSCSIVGGGGGRSVDRTLGPCTRAACPHPPSPPTHPREAVVTPAPCLRLPPSQLSRCRHRTHQTWSKCRPATAAAWTCFRQVGTPHITLARARVACAVCGAWSVRAVPTGGGRGRICRHPLQGLSLCPCSQCCTVALPSSGDALLPHRRCPDVPGGGRDHCRSYRHQWRVPHRRGCGRYDSGGKCAPLYRAL